MSGQIWSEMPLPTDPPLVRAVLNAMDVVPGAPDRGAAALHLLDWLGCALAGVATPVGRAMAGAAAPPRGRHPMSPGERSLPELAWALGSFGSLLEMDDVHRTAILHPGPVVIPAVLACASPDTAQRVPEGILRGYEAMIRLGRSVGPAHYASFHNTSTCGGFGAAVASAWMLGLDGASTEWAVAHALSTAGGLWECRNEPGATKHLHVAEAARRGVQAALAARAGIAGPTRILEGAQGFYAALAPDGRPGALLEGAPWALHQASFKPWPACRHAHPAIDAALALRSQLGNASPARIVIETYADAVLFCDRPAPRDPAEARFSLQHAVAVALADGPPTLAAFEAGALGEPRHARLRSLCTVREDPAMTARYPAHFGATVRVTADGEEHVYAVPDAWGDSENPMSPDAVHLKFDSLAAHGGIPRDHAAALRAAALDAADGPGAATLRDLMETLPPTTWPEDTAA